MAVTNIYGFKELTGGAIGSLDSVDGSGLADNDLALGISAGIFYTYILDEDSALSESSPNIIAPDTNAGDKRWILQSLYGAALYSGAGLTVATLKVTTGAAAGNLLVSDADGDLAYLAAGATTTILVGGGAANPVWTTATGTGAPVRATSPTLVTPLLGTPTSGVLTNCTGLPQASVVGLTTTDSPVFVTVKLSGLTDGYVPYHVADATGLANSPMIVSGARVGIGVSPSNTFDIKYDSAAYSDTGWNVGGLYLRTAAGAGIFSGIGFGAVGDREAFFGVVEGSASDIGHFVFQGYDGVSHTYKEYMRVTNAGNVGIGTTAPGDILHVQNSTTNDLGGITITNANTSGYGSRLTFASGYHGGYSFAALETENSSTGGRLAIYTADTSHVLQERIRINESGNVGIGTTAPAVRLNIDNQSAQTYPTLGTAAGQLMLSVAGAYGLHLGLDTATGTGWIQQMRDDAATAYNLILQPVGGNVGIGTTAPGVKLDIGDNTASAAQTTARICGGTASDTAPILDLFRYSQATWSIATGGPSADDFVIAVNRAGATDAQLASAAMLTILNVSGNVGIGTAAPDVNLHVESAVTPRIKAKLITDTTSYAALIANNDVINQNMYMLASGSARAGTSFGVSNNGLMLLYSNNTPLAIGTADSYNLTIGTNNTARITILAAGNVGIGTTAPERVLDVNGIARATIQDLGGQVINVKAHGVVGDDTGDGTGTDDHVAIQHILDNHAQNNIIYFPPGYYSIGTSTLTFTSGKTTIIGAGNNLTYIVSNSTSADILQIGNGTDVLSGIIIKDLCFLPTAHNPTGWAVSTSHCTNITLNSVNTYGASGTGDRLNGFKFHVYSYVTVKDCTITYPHDDGIYLSGDSETGSGRSSSCDILNTVVLVPGQDGISLSTYVEGVRIHNSTIQTAGRYAIALAPASHSDYYTDAIIDSCFMDGWGTYAILIDHFHNINITNCIFDGTKMAIETTGTETDGYIINGNRFTVLPNAANSVTIVGANGVNGVITGNSFNGGSETPDVGIGGSAVYMGASSTGVCTGNRIFNVSGTHVTDSSSGGWILEHNT